MGNAPAKINSVPSVAFVPRITTSPSEGAPMNEPTATPIATTSAIRYTTIITDKEVTQSYVRLDYVSFPFLFQHL